MRRRVVIYCLVVLCALSVSGCDISGAVSDGVVDSSSDTSELGLRDVAGILSALPLQGEHLVEVYDAVNSSSGNGYDEEYMMRNLLESPGSGVGDDARAKAEKSSGYARPIRALLEEYLAGRMGTKAGAADVQAYLDKLSASDIQIYWPYSEDWDGRTYPLVTFDPGYGAESNYGYEVRPDGRGLAVTDSVYIDEAVAASRPVWVINRNDDSAFSPRDMIVPSSKKAVTKSGYRTLYLKDFTMLRNYDSWFAGASEFRIQIGAAKDFKASTDSELLNYSPSITEMTVVVKRKQKGVKVVYDSVLMADFSGSLEKVAFLLTEDDGGTITSWKCSGVVKYASKSYGFELEIPYRDRDDIVWRGQLTTDFFQKEDEVSGRFGDTIVTFALE